MTCHAHWNCTTRGSGKCVSEELVMRTRLWSTGGQLSLRSAVGMRHPLGGTYLMGRCQEYDVFDYDDLGLYV